MIPDQITFSDTAKYADAARSLAQGGQYLVHHSFFDPSVIAQGNTGFPANFPPLPSVIMSFAFRFFGASDQTVIGLGIFLYLILLLSIFLFARKMFSVTVGVVATALMLSDRYFFFYAQNFTPELLLSLWILLTCYFLTRPKHQKLLVFIPIFLSYLTKQQYSVIFAATIVTAYLQLTRSFTLIKKIRTLIVVAIIFVIFIALGNLNVASNFSPIKAMYSANMLPGIVPGDYLRGEITTPIGLKAVASKLFYNVYNFAKDPSRITTWIIILGAILSLGLKDDKKGVVFGVINFVYILFFLLVLASSISLPNARYIHPITPLLSIVAAAGLVNTLRYIKSGNKILLLILLLALVPTIGSYSLDKRFESAHQNAKKPGAVQVISKLIDDHTDNGLILTNFDAWGAWYNNLTTMWFPLNMSYLTDLDKNIPYIAITDYNSDDADFRLNDWAELLSAEGVNNTPLDDKYVMIYRGVIRPEETKENKEIQIVILKHK